MSEFSGLRIFIVTLSLVSLALSHYLWSAVHVLSFRRLRHIAFHFDFLPFFSSMPRTGPSTSRRYPTSLLSISILSAQIKTRPKPGQRNI